MDHRFSKPIVFLSHSKKDIVFIKRLVEDLRISQIEPWLDENEIRHGKSWQESIFEYGIARCDAIIVYFTETSVVSPVVKKEMDAGILQTLDDSNIAFLPYVSEEKIRDLLRPDIRALQSPIWNDENYASVLPTVVAEIWRSFLERTVASATKDERLKRVQLELELEKNKNQTENFFSKSENAEFDFLWNSFNEMVPLTLDKNVRNPKDEKDNHVVWHEFTVSLSSLIACLTDYSRSELNLSLINYNIYIKAITLFEIPAEIFKDTSIKLSIEGLPDITKLLLMYDLVENLHHTSTGPYNDTNLVSKIMFSKKYFRFRYWLAYNKKLPDSIRLEKSANKI